MDPNSIQQVTSAETEVHKPARRKRLVLRIAAVIAAGFIALLCLVFILPFWGFPFNGSRHGPPPLTPPWALECWLWEDDSNTASAVNELLDGYARHDIPVRTILIDSPWSHRYNDFKVDEQRYPEPAKFFGDLQDRGYRVVLWMTPMVNSFSKDTRLTSSAEFFETARSNHFLAANGRELRWWKGRGGFIDYTSPAALKWWQSLQQQVLDWGIDGWKLDGSDTLFSSSLWGIPLPFARSHSGWLTTRQYMDLYAREEYRHGLAANPDFVTLIRSKDQPWTHPEGFAPVDAAPVTWVGDNQHTWSKERRGIQRAILDILGSARLGYCVCGSDVGGYHGRFNPERILQKGNYSGVLSKTNSDVEFGTAPKDDPIPPTLYIRWAQFSAFCGLFLNGGHGERRLWKRTPAELEIIRKFSWLHTELVPYMYSHVVRSHRGGKPLMQPIQGSEYDYFFGDNFFISPIYTDSTRRAFRLPSGKWRYLFNEKEVLQGPIEITRDFGLEEFPVYVRDGSITPLRVSRSYTGLGDGSSAGHLTWLIFPGPEASFTAYDTGTHPTPESITLRMTMEGSQLKLSLNGKHQSHVFQILLQKHPSRVELDGSILEEGSSWQYSEERQRLTIRTDAYSTGKYVVYLADTK